MSIDGEDLATLGTSDSPTASTPVVVQAALRLDLEDLGTDPLVDAYVRVAGPAAVYAPRQIALARVERGDVRSTLVIDGEWLDLALETSQIDRTLIEGVDLPREAVIAVLPEWPQDWDGLEVDRLQRRIYDGVCYIAA